MAASVLMATSPPVCPDATMCDGVTLIIATSRYNALPCFIMNDFSPTAHGTDAITHSDPWIPDSLIPPS